MHGSCAANRYAFPHVVCQTGHLKSKRNNERSCTSKDLSCRGKLSSHKTSMRRHRSHRLSFVLVLTVPLSACKYPRCAKNKLAASLISVCSSKRHILNSGDQGASFVALLMEIIQQDSEVQVSATSIKQKTRNITNKTKYPRTYYTLV
jgi:hypothetical protein